MLKLVVLSCLLAAAAASVGLIAPFAPIAYTTPLWAPSNYRGPLSLAPGQPANILGSDGRPLDTIEVNLDRSAHIAAKTLGLHLLKKRSAPLFSPIGGLAVAHSSLITPAGSLAYSASLGSHVRPISYHAPLVHW